MIGDRFHTTMMARDAYLMKQLGHGDAEVTYGGGEKPRYGALRRAISRYYADLLRPLGSLRKAAFLALPFPDPAKAKQDDEPFRYTAAQKRLIDDAIDIFLDEIAGPDRTREGFVAGGAESDTSDGIIQQHDILAYAVGLMRGADLMDAAQTLQAGRQNPAVQEMLEHAFDRLSDKGALRLELVRDDIHGILAGAQAAGLNPLETARQLGDQFDEYAGWEFQRLARTEAAFASEAGVRDQMGDMGVERVEWLISDGACPICEGYDGQQFDIDDEDNLPPGHPNAFAQ
jgi:hypothetical protein